MDTVPPNPQDGLMEPEAVLDLLQEGAHQLWRLVRDLPPGDDLSRAWVALDNVVGQLEDLIAPGDRPKASTLTRPAP